MSNEEKKKRRDVMVLAGPAVWWWWWCGAALLCMYEVVCVGQKSWPMLIGADDGDTLGHLSSCHGGDGGRSNYRQILKILVQIGQSVINSWICSHREQIGLCHGATCLVNNETEKREAKEHGVGHGWPRP